MRIFISAGEPSGDLHGANLIAGAPCAAAEAEFVGFGGPKMSEAGAKLLYPLVNLAVMWFLNVFLNIVTFIRLICRADRYFRDQKPDAVILIDYPGLHWWLAKRAKARGIPVFYYVPPQLWAWAGWRVKKVRRTRRPGALQPALRARLVQGTGRQPGRVRRPPVLRRARRAGAR